MKLLLLAAPCGAARVRSPHPRALPPQPVVASPLRPGGTKCGRVFYIAEPAFLSELERHSLNKTIFNKGKIIEKEVYQTCSDS